MRVTVLGSGNFEPSARNPAGYAVELEDGVVLLDLGFGNVRQLARAGIALDRVTDALFTHRHPDHCGDLAALLFHYNATGRRAPLNVWGPPGFSAFVRRLRKAFSPWTEPCYPLRCELPPFAEALRVPHSTPAAALKLRAEGRTLVYTGDTGPSRELAAFARGCDLLIVEATTPRPYPGHLSAAQARELAADSGAKRVLYSHLSRESAALLPAGRRARDLMRITL